MKTVLWIIAALFVSSGVLAAEDKQGHARKGQEKAPSKQQQDPSWPKTPHRLSGDRYAEPGAPTDYTKHSDTKHESR
jgi:hypothetical protein